MSLPEIATALEQIKDRSTVDLTTTGRSSGKPRTQPIWFVVADGKVYVQAGKGGKRDWFLNLQANPVVTLRQGTYTFRARATVITDPARAQHVHDLFLAKYTSAWLLSFLGSSIGRGVPAELIPFEVAGGTR